MFAFRYKTTKNKRIDVFFNDDKTVWIDYKDLGFLFYPQQKQIEESIKKRQAEEENLDKKSIIEYEGKLLINILAFLFIGLYANEAEAVRLLHWYKFMTKEYDTETSEEFVENIKSIMSSDENK